MPRLTRLLAILALLEAALPSLANAAPRTQRDPTPLRLVAARSAGLEGDGERFVIVVRWLGDALGYGGDVYDTWTGRRSQLPAECEFTGSMDQTTDVTAGRMLLSCPEGFALLDLASGVRRALPDRVSDGSLQTDRVSWSIVGRRWVAGSSGCQHTSGAQGFCNAYTDIRTGAARVVRDRFGDRDARTYRDLDDPGLPVRTYCRGRGEIAREYSRLHSPPYYVGARGVHRCRDGRPVRDLGRSAPYGDLAGGQFSWGTGRYGDGRAHVYDIAGDLVRSWKVPPPPGRRRVEVAVAHTRCAIFTATSLAWTDDGYVTSARIHRADLPRPRDRRCPR